MSTPRYWCCSADFGQHEKSCKNYAEGVAAPLEPNPQLEENHHWKWFQEFGAKECPYAHQDWHKESPSLCRPCEYANKAARAYAAAVSKNLTDKYAEMEAKWVRELLTVSNEIGEARDRMSDLLNHDGGPGSIDYDAAKVFRARAKLLEFREITALREKPAK